MPELRYRFQALNAQEVIRSLASINAEMRVGASLSRDYAKSVGGVRGPRAGASAGGSSSARGGVRYEERLAQQVAKAQERAFARSETEKTRTLEREVRRRSQIEERHQRYKERVKNTSMLRDQRDEERHARARLREHARIQREHERARDNGIQERARMGTLFGGIAGGAVIGAGVIAGGAAVQVGGAAIRKRLSMEESATRLAVNARQKGQRGVSAGQLMGEAEQTAKSVSGSKAEDIIAAQLAYVTKTGDLDQARRFSKAMAMTSIATGADAADIGATAGAIRNKFGIDNEEDMKRVLSTMTFQGKAAEFEMADMATYFNEMGSAGARFGLDKGAGGVQMLGTLAQIARMSTGSGAEASTGVQAMFRQLISRGAEGGAEGIAALTGGKKNAKGKYEGGAQVFTDASRTKARDIQSVMKDVIAGTGGDLGKLQKIFGDEGMKGAAQFIKTFNDAQNALGPNATKAQKEAAGRKAIDDLFAQNNVTTGWSELEKDANTVGGTTTSKLTTLGETLMAEMGAALSPAIAALSKHIGLLTGPIQSAGKNLTLLSEAFADLVTVLVEAGIVDPKVSATPEGALALAQLSKNDLELADLAEKEKTFGLTTEQGYRKAELLSENVALAQGAVKGTNLETGYNAYKSLVETTNAAPWMKGAKPIEAMDFASYLRGTDQYKVAGKNMEVIDAGSDSHGNKWRDARGEWAGTSQALSLLGGPAAGGVSAALDLGAMGLDAAMNSSLGKPKGQGSGEMNVGLLESVLTAAAQEQRSAAEATAAAARQLALAGTPGAGNP